MKRSDWQVHCFGGRAFVFMTNHPLEERIVHLDELPKDEFGHIVLPDVAWDGVETCPGLMLAAQTESDPADDLEETLH